MNPKLIVIDGKSYSSVNEMPPDVRAKYEQAMSSLQGGKIMDALGDKDKNGMPDVFENMAGTNVMSSNMKFIVNGQEYNVLDSLPPEARAKYEQAMGQLDKNKNGIPDFVEGMMNIPNQMTSNVQSTPVMTSPRPSRPMPVNSTIEPESSGGWALALAGVALLGLCALGAVGIWYFFIR
jgi:hypothetical protein